MRNTAIFLLLVAIAATTIVLTVGGTSRTATVTGRFTEQLGGIDNRWAYLRTEQDDRVLDSCLIQDNSFSLAGEIPGAELPCRITFRGLEFTARISLRPRQQIELSVNLDSENDLRRQCEEAVREAIARLDANGLTLPDSMWRDSVREREIPCF